MRSGSAPDAAPWIALVALGIAAAVLALIGLGDLPLRDFDEATVARVALELRHGLGEAPLLPTLWDKPYLNKAPGLHSLIALVIGATTQHNQLPSEWTIRLAPALLSCLVVPLGGWLQWTLRPGDRSSALATSVILLTLLPVARHGRLAMLDGTQLSAMALLWLALLQLNGSRTSALWGAVAGLMASAMLLLKAPLLVPAAVAAGLALAWGQEWKSWNNKSAALIGMLLGLAPGIGWHLWHAHIRGSEALWLWGGDGAGRVLLDAGEGSDLGWRVPVIEVLEGGWPWLPLLPFALVWAWRWRQSRWGRWSLASLLTLAGAILPLRTQLPWYSHPLWLPIALLCAPLLAWLVERPSSSSNAPGRPKSPLALAAVAASDVLVRARTAAPAALAEQLQQHRQQPCALPRPGGCAGPRLVWRRMVAALWRTTATTPWGDQPQLRQCGSAGPAVSLPPVVVGAQRNLARATGGSPGQSQPWRRDQAEGLRRTPQPQLVCRTTHSAFQRWPRPPSQRQAAEGLHHRRPSGAMDPGQLSVA